MKKSKLGDEPPQDRSPFNKSTNLSAIHHARFDSLYELTGNYNKSTLLDKLIYWWQISTFTLDDDRIWFTRSIEQISEQSKISRRSVERYLAEFESAGLIERVNRLMRVKHLYIRITEKLLALIQQGSASTVARRKEETSSPDSSCFFSNHNGVIDSAKKAGSIYEVKVNNHNEVINNTVSKDSPVNNPEKNIDKKHSNPLNPASEIFPVEPMIGERITERLKNYIKGMIKNTQGQYNLQFSDPNRLFAEIVFSVTQDVQWNGITNPHHRVNIIAKSLRQKQWKTPKGFFNHWDVGQYFRDRDKQKFALEQERKHRETYCASDFFSDNHSEIMELFPETKTQNEYSFSGTQHQINILQEQQKSSLNQLAVQLHAAERRFHEVQRFFENGKPGFSRALVDCEAIRVAQLYEERQQLLEQMQGQRFHAA